MNGFDWTKQTALVMKPTLVDPSGTWWVPITGPYTGDPVRSLLDRQAERMGLRIVQVNWFRMRAQVRPF